MTNIEKIEARLDAITDLMTFQSETDILRARLKKLLRSIFGSISVTD